MPVDEHGFARRPAKKLIDRRAKRLALDVPQRCIDGADRRHRHGTPTPVRAGVEVLPRVFDAARVAADEQRHDVIAQVAGDGELAAIQRRVAQPVDAVLRYNLQGDEVSARAADNHFRVDDLHRPTCAGVSRGASA